VTSRRQVPCGTKYGALTLVEVTGRRQNNRVVYRWQCECGNEIFAHVQNIRLAKLPSCGCLTHSLKSEARRTSHGASLKRSSLYPTWVAWQSMHWRCTNERRRDFPAYGGRGITVCPRWSSFPLFLSDMGARPIGGSLDRIDVNGNYEPGNCRWANATQQSNNKRNNRRIEFAGDDLTLSEWARKTHIPRDTLANRIDSGWELSRALNTPVMNRGPNTRRQPNGAHSHDQA
jgi:hypothetical protein